MKEPILLSIETSTNSCSIAIHQGKELLSDCNLHISKSHSSVLTLLIKEQLTHCTLLMNDLSAVVVSGGPGSYTGLRIGLSTAKGICQALDVPLIEISSLDAMALSFFDKRSNEIFNMVPVLDARRMEVFYKIITNDFKEIQPVSNLIFEKNSFDDLLKDGKLTYLMGQGAQKAKELYHDLQNLIIIENVYPEAKYIGVLGLQKYQKKDFESLIYFEPKYGKEFYSPKSKKKSFLNK